MLPWPCSRCETVNCEHTHTHIVLWHKQWQHCVAWHCDVHCKTEVFPNCDRQFDSAFPQFPLWPMLMQQSIRNVRYSFENTYIYLCVRRLMLSSPTINDCNWSLAECNQDYTLLPVNAMVMFLVNDVSVKLTLHSTWCALVTRLGTRKHTFTHPSGGVLGSLVHKCN